MRRYYVYRKAEPPEQEKFYDMKQYNLSGILKIIIKKFKGHI